MGVRSCCCLRNSQTLENKGLSKRSSGKKVNFIDIAPSAGYDADSLARRIHEKERETMDNKQSFGAFICQRRKELGLTQKEFAQKLYVTDSAVSKWERGLAYPDIGLLQSICEILQISEKELLSASEDTECRRAEQLARKYLRLARNYRIIQYVIYGLALLVCFIANLAVQHTLDWFWIVLTSVGMAASLTLLPALVKEGYRGLWTLAGFAGALLLLLLASCLYSGGDWFIIAAVSVVFGMSVVFLPFVLAKLPLPETVRKMRFTLYLGIELLLLILLYGVCCLHQSGTWFVSAVLWTVFGVFVPFLPVALKQTLGAFPHKALAYFFFESILLIVGVLWETGGGSAFSREALPIVLACLVLPWGWMGALRYLPVGRWLRASVGMFWTGLWAWVMPWGMERIYMLNGWRSTDHYTLQIPCDFTNWADYGTRGANILVLVLLGFGLLGLLFGAIGLRIALDKRK